MDIHYSTFRELYDQEIHYSYEHQYGVIVGSRLGSEVIAYVVFNKLILESNGNGSYKTHSFTFDTRLWPKILAFAEMLQETRAEKLLYKP